MNYNNREVEDLGIYVRLGNSYIDKFRKNQSYVANILRKNKIKGWSYTEAIFDDVVLVTCSENSLEGVNRLFEDVKKVFNNVSISVFYDDFGDYEYNEEEFNECLKNELCLV